MSADAIIGLVVTGVIGFAVGYLMLNKQPPIFRMFLGMLAIALGYLYFTGAIEDIGARFARHMPGKAPAVKTEAAPAPETKTEAAAPAQSDATHTTPADAPGETKTAPAGEAAKPAPHAEPGASKPAQ